MISKDAYSVYSHNHFPQLRIAYVWPVVTYCICQAQLTLVCLYVMADLLENLLYPHDGLSVDADFVYRTSCCPGVSKPIISRQKLANNLRSRAFITSVNTLSQPGLSHLIVAYLFIPYPIVSSSSHNHQLLASPSSLRLLWV